MVLLTLFFHWLGNRHIGCGGQGASVHWRRFFIRPLLSGLWFRGSGICCLSARTQKSPVFSFSGRGDSFICYHVFYRFCSGENIPSEMVGLLTEKISIWRLCQPSIHGCVGNLCRSLYLLYQPSLKELLVLIPSNLGTILLIVLYAVLCLDLAGTIMLSSVHSSCEDSLSLRVYLKICKRLQIWWAKGWPDGYRNIWLRLIPAGGERIISCPTGKGTAAWGSQRARRCVCCRLFVL